MAISVDDILITRKNVFLLSGGRQYVADIESATNMQDFDGDSIDVNPWNLYNDDGHIISNLFDSSEFNIRTQLLNSDSSISPNNKNRHETFMMPSPETYVGNCQVGNVGYSVSDVTTEKFSMPVVGADSYEADYSFCQYYYLSSVSSEDGNYIEPDIVYTPRGGVQYISEYPLDKMYSDFGDNDLDDEDSAIDVPTIYGDTMLAKYFYDGSYSVNGKLSESDSSDIIFRNMRTYYGMGHNGDTTYMVYRNDATAHSNAYGRYRPHDTEVTVNAHVLSTVGDVEGFSVLSYPISGIREYRTFTANTLYSTFKVNTTAFSGYYLVQSFHPEDSSFVLYAALSATDGAAVEAYDNKFDTLLYYPKSGNSSNRKIYSFKYPDTEGQKECASDITFVELEHSVIIGTRYNGSVLVISEAYGYQDPNFPETNSINNFTPFIGPILAAHPNNGGIVGYTMANTLGFEVDDSGRSDVYYNGSDILVIKKYDTANNVTSCRMFLSRDITADDGTMYMKGRYFSAAWPSVSAIPSNASYYDIPTIRNDFRPIFDRCTEGASKAAGLELVPDNISHWTIDATSQFNGHNSIKIHGTLKGEKTYATTAIDGTFTLSLSLKIAEKYKHLRFKLYDSAKGDSPVSNVTTTNNTWTTVSYSSDEIGSHVIKLEFEDTCDSSACIKDVAWISNLRLTYADSDIEPSDFTATSHNTFTLSNTDISHEAEVKVGNHVFIQYSDGLVNRCHVDSIFSDGWATKTLPCGPSNGPSTDCRLDDMRFVGGKSRLNEINSMIGNGASGNKVMSYMEVLPMLIGSYTHLTTSNGNTVADKKYNSFATHPLTRRSEFIYATEDSAHANYNIEFIGGDQTNPKRLEFISGYPIETSNGVTLRTYAPEGTTHNSAAALVYFNGAVVTDTVNDTMVRDYFQDSTSVGGLYLNYQGITTDLMLKHVGGVIKTQTCPNGIYDCSNHPPKISYANTYSGYAFPHPSYGRFVTAGTGLGIFDGPMSPSVTVGDIMMLNSQLIVKNYSVEAHAVSGGSVADKTFPIPTPKYATGGYVVADMSHNGTVSNSDKLYTVKSIFNNTDTNRSESLSRLVPSKPIEFYPESREDVEWKPFYAGKTVDFIRYGNGYYYIALHDASANYDIVETESLYVEKTLTKLDGARRVTDVRFIGGDTVVEYSIDNTPYVLKHARGGTMDSKRVFVDSDTVEVLNVAPSKMRMFKYADGVHMLYGEHMRSTILSSSDAKMMADTLLSKYTNTTHDSIYGKLMAFGTVNNSNGRISYNNVSDDYSCGSTIESDDATMPLSGIHELFGKCMLITDDDSAYEDSFGNGVRVKRWNSDIEWARISNGGTTISEYVQMVDGCYSYIGRFTDSNNVNYCCVFNRSTGKAYVSTDYTIGGTAYCCGRIFVEVNGTYDNAVKLTSYCDSLNSKHNFLLSKKKSGDVNGSYHIFDPSGAKEIKSDDVVPTPSVAIDTGAYMTGDTEFFEDTSITFAERVLENNTGDDKIELYFGKSATYAKNGDGATKLTGLDGTVVDVLHSNAPYSTAASYIPSVGASIIVKKEGGALQLGFVDATNDTYKITPSSEIYDYRKVRASDGTIRALVMYDGNNKVSSCFEFLCSSKYDYSEHGAIDIPNTFTRIADPNTYTYSVHDIDGNSNMYFGLIISKKDVSTGSAVKFRIRESDATSTPQQVDIPSISANWAPYVSSITINGGNLFTISDYEPDAFNKSKSYSITFDDNACVNRTVIYKCKTNNNSDFFNPEVWTVTDSLPAVIAYDNINPTGTYSSPKIFTKNEEYFVLLKNNIKGSVIKGDIDGYDDRNQKSVRKTYMRWQANRQYTANCDYVTIEKKYVSIGTFSCAPYRYWNTSQRKRETGDSLSCMLDQPLSIMITDKMIRLNKSENWKYSTKAEYLGKTLNASIWVRPDSDGENAEASITFDYPYYYRTSNDKNAGKLDMRVATMKLDSSVKTHIEAADLYKHGTLPLSSYSGKLPSGIEKSSIVIAKATLDEIKSMCKSSEISSIHDLAARKLVNVTDVNDPRYALMCDDDIVVANIPGCGMYSASASETTTVGDNTVEKKYRTQSIIDNTVKSVDVDDGGVAYIPLNVTTQNTDMSKYDSVETMYSINRFTSQTMHKSNLFSIRIDDLGISDSPYLSEDQKTQISQWMKNHVTDIVNAVKPAQTELFDVILG